MSWYSHEILSKLFFTNCGLNYYVEILQLTFDTFSSSVLNTFILVNFVITLGKYNLLIFTMFNFLILNAQPYNIAGNILVLLICDWLKPINYNNINFDYSKRVIYFKTNKNSIVALYTIIYSFFIIFQLFQIFRHNIFVRYYVI